MFCFASSGLLLNQHRILDATKCGQGETGPLLRFAPPQGQYAPGYARTSPGKYMLIYYNLAQHAWASPSHSTAVPGHLAAPQAAAGAVRP